MQYEPPPNIITLHASNLHVPEITGLITVDFRHVIAITEDHVKSGDKVEVITWVYLPGTRFAVQETRKQILELISWNRYNKQVLEPGVNHVNKFHGS